MNYNFTYDVSFIIPTKNEKDNIERCIESIKRSSVNYNIEIIVVDNGSSDNTVEIARNCGAKVYIIPYVTISRLRNEGAKYSNSKNLAFIDADVMILDGWIEACFQTMQEFNSSFVGSSPSIPENNTWVERVWYLQVLARGGVSIRPWLASMNIMIKKDVFFSVGGFSENLLTGEDVDLGRKLSGSCRIVSNDKIKAVHYGEAKNLLQFYKERVLARTLRV